MHPHDQPIPFSGHCFTGAAIADLLARLKPSTALVKRWHAAKTTRNGWFGHRDYAPGDDYRAVDWNLCARHDELRTRPTPDPFDPRLYILLDCSRSMAADGPETFDAARWIAAAIAWAAASELVEVHLTAFADRAIADSGPIRGSAALGRLAGFLDRLSPDGTRTDFARAAAGFARRSQRRGPVVAISDLYAWDGFERGLNLLGEQGYSPGVIRLYDPREVEPRIQGDAALVDVETGEVRGTTLTERDVRYYTRLLKEFAASVQGYCRRRRVPYVPLAANTPQPAMLRQLAASGMVCAEVRP